MKNPQAFPITIIERLKFGREFKTRSIEYEGMNLLDYFAGQALANSRITMDESYPPLISKLVYDLAEAMLDERERRNK